MWQSHESICFHKLVMWQPHASTSFHSIVVWQSHASTSFHRIVMWHSSMKLPVLFKFLLHDILLVCFLFILSTTQLSYVFFTFSSEGHMKKYLLFTAYPYFKSIENICFHKNSETYKKGKRKQKQMRKANKMLHIGSSNNIGYIRLSSPVEFIVCSLFTFCTCAI